MFLPQGQQIAAVKGREGPPSDRDRRRPRRSRRSIPLIVMTDERTASASEIVDRRAAGPRPRARRRPDELRQGPRAGRLQPRRRLRAQAHDRQMVHAERPIDSASAQVRERAVRRERRPTRTRRTRPRRTRPAYKSDGGRIVYGGGGITPDVIVQDDTLTTAEQQFAKAIAPKGQDFVTVLTDYSMELAKTATPTLHRATGVAQRVLHAAAGQGRYRRPQEVRRGHRYVSRLLDQRVAHYAFGDSTAKRRDLPVRRAAPEGDRASRQGRVAARPVRHGGRAA